MKVALLHGGGLESNILFFELLARNEIFDCVWFDYSQAAVKEEFDHVKKACTDFKVTLGVMKLPFLEKEKSLLFGTGDSHVVNGRNLYFLIEALKYYDVVYLGTTAKDTAPDATKDYIDSVTRTVDLAFSGQKKVFFPLYNEDPVAVGKKMIGSIPKMKDYIFSCWTPVDGNPCGKCAHCNKIKSLE